MSNAVSQNNDVIEFLDSFVLPPIKRTTYRGKVQYVPSRYQEDGDIPIWDNVDELNRRQAIRDRFFGAYK